MWQNLRGASQGVGCADVTDRFQEAQMRDTLKHAFQVCVAVGLATVPLIATAFMQNGGGHPARVAVYATVGEELITFSADIERATLTRQSSIMLPGFVQEAWVSPSGPFLYVAWSNGGASYAGTSITGATIAPRNVEKRTRWRDPGFLHEAGKHDRRLFRQRRPFDVGAESDELFTDTRID